MFIYTKLPKENENDPQLIKKEGITATFSMEQIQSDLVRFQQIEKGLKGQIDVEKAKTENIKAHHPFILDLTEEQLSTASLYFQAYSVLRAAEQKLEQVNAAFAEYATELQEIESQTGEKLPS